MKKFCGVDLSAKEAVFYAIDERGGEVMSGKIKIEDADDPQQLIEFKEKVSQLLNEEFAGIAIAKRTGKGKFAASPQSFKLEAVLQLLKPQIQLISPQTVKAFLKKQPNLNKAKYSYQEKALDLAFFLSKN